MNSRFSQSACTAMPTFTAFVIPPARAISGHYFRSTEKEERDPNEAQQTFEVVEESDYLLYLRRQASLIASFCENYDFFFFVWVKIPV